MKILGIDFGKKNIGLAIAEDFLPEPHSKLKIKNEKLKIERIKRICETERIDKIVIGISEGRMARETRKFGERLKRATGLSVDYQDETLTSEEAKRLMVKIGKPKKKRREQTDAIAAALILQDYLERKKSTV